ncbi:MAG: hypothetical protein ACJA06_001076 [Halocynthiibacter sp.]|jgi:hypothetical protein
MFGVRLAQGLNIQRACPLIDLLWGRDNNMRAKFKRVAAREGLLWAQKSVLTGKIHVWRGQRGKTAPVTGKFWLKPA